ncbi:hypothetical protein D920_00861 [Enterococcus faecalis 13-SD-W-01]|nr:hypothetical protein D920_00861 [Enterococcus faecalis 13-SD-W-01]
MKSKKGQNIKQHLSIFAYEKEKLNKLFLCIFLTTVSSQVSAFLFFGLVGKLDPEELFLKEFQTVFALASTITMCILSVTGSIFIRKKVIRFYIGNQRSRIFLFPIKRSNLFIMKMAAFLVVVAAGIFLGMNSGLFLSVCLGFLLKLNTGTLFLQFFLGIVICLAVVLLTVTVISFSSVIAIWRQSETAVLVASVLSIVIVSNLFAVGAIEIPGTLLIVYLIFSVGCLLFLLRFSKRIDEMDI